jgi:hypothetical protein
VCWTSSKILHLCSREAAGLFLGVQWWTAFEEIEDPLK